MTKTYKQSFFFLFNLLAITDMESHSSLYVINYHKLFNEIDPDQ